MFRGLSNVSMCSYRKSPTQDLEGSKACIENYTECNHLLPIISHGMPTRGHMLMGVSTSKRTISPSGGACSSSRFPDEETEEEHVPFCLVEDSLVKEAVLSVQIKQQFVLPLKKKRKQNRYFFSA